MQRPSGVLRNKCLGEARTSCYDASDALWLFRGSSAVEQPAVNRLVVGSNPTRGANFQLSGPEAWVTKRPYDMGDNLGPEQVVCSQ